MDLLLHCCCGPCATGSIPQFQEAGYQPTGWFYNPNIHPWQEQKARRESFELLMQQLALPYHTEAGYPLEDWLKQVAQQPEQRCEFCYRSRLEPAARLAAEKGFSCFSTTLLISPYQQHELIKALGEEYAQRYQVRFVYLDLRPRFRAGNAEARERGLYMQKYCGCIYSEKDRYVKPSREGVLL